MLGDPCAVSTGQGVLAGIADVVTVLPAVALTQCEGDDSGQAGEQRDREGLPSADAQRGHRGGRSWTEFVRQSNNADIRSGPKLGMAISRNAATTTTPITQLMSR